MMSGPLKRDGKPGLVYSRHELLDLRHAPASTRCIHIDRLHE